MLKKIKVTSLCKGMYIDNLKCSWFNHPFAFNQFKLENDNDIRKIVAAGIKDLVIDTSKGCDVPVVKKTTEKVVVPEVLPISEKVVARVSVAQEMKQAKEAFTEATKFSVAAMSNVKMGKNIELEEVTFIINKMSASILRNPYALLALLRIRTMDQYTFEHSVSVSVLLMSFAQSMGLSLRIIKELGIGGLLHDIGKTLIPSEILNKPGKLTVQEFLIMKKHVIYGQNILQKTSGFSQIVLDVVSQHHERYDGSGYPRQLKGEGITLYGQMSAIADVYDAMTSNRCYHKGREPSEVLKILFKLRGKDFNSKLVQQFIQSVGIYPVGSLVLLSNQYLAKVVDIDENLLKPEVELFLNAKNRSYVPSQTLKLSEHPDIKVISVESYVKWGINL